MIICGSELATLQYSIVNKYSIVQNNRYLICLLFSIKVCTKVHGMYMANLIFQANIFDHYLDRKRIIFSFFNSATLFSNQCFSFLLIKAKNLTNNWNFFWQYLNSLMSYSISKDEFIFNCILTVVRNFVNFFYLKICRKSCDQDQEQFSFFLESRDTSQQWTRTPSRLG